MVGACGVKNDPIAPAGTELPKWQEKYFQSVQKTKDKPKKKTQ